MNVSGPRVLQVVLSLNPGGTERLVVELASRLHREMPMMVCCLDAAGSWARELEEDGIPVHALGRTPGFHPSLGRAIAHLSDSHGADVIHAHHYSPFVYSCIARCWRRGTTVVFTEHGRLSDAAPSAKRRMANRMLVRFPRQVFAVSHDLKEHLVGEGFPDNHVGVIYNGIDVGPLPGGGTRARIRRSLGATDEDFVIGTIARLDPVKSLGTLIEAVARLAHHSRVVLAIVGDGPERKDLETLASHLHVEEHVHFLGEQHDARRWLAGCDVYVNCSISEGVSLTILEAMAAGLPVIATRVGGTAEVVNESCGRLIPPRSIDALVDALIACMQEPSTRSRLGRAARCRVERSFTLDRMVGEYHDVYVNLSEAH
jgi:glycosyltransferase involved in cell wall biosynthesis